VKEGECNSKVVFDYIYKKEGDVTEEEKE